MTWTRIGVFGMGLCLALVGRASAVEDLTGTYDVRLSCKAIDPGGSGKFKETSVVEVEDDGSGIVLIDWPGLFEFRTFLVADARKPEQGALAGVNCDLSFDNLDGAALAVDVKTKAGKDKASFKGTMVRPRIGGPSIFTCKVKGKRTSTLIKGFEVCPP